MDTETPLEERLVPSEWPTQGNAKIAFIGEAPSTEELEEGRPFVGPAGRLFNAMLRAANIDRSACFIGNVFQFKLPENSTVAYRKFVGEAEYKAVWQKNVARLKDELETYGPNVVVPLGNTALLALAGTASIGNLRGHVVQAVPPMPPFKLVPTYHPAFVLRQIKLYTITVMDFVKADAEARRGPEIIYPKRELIINPTIDEVEHYLAEWEKTDLLSCDIETGWSMIRGIAFAPNQEIAMYVPFVTLDRHDRNYWRTLDEEVRAWRAVKRILESPVPKLGQNFAHYDWIWLFKQAGIKVRNLRHDTRLLHHALYAELPKSLGFMAANYSTQGAWKHWAEHSGIRKKDRREKRDE